MFLDSLDAGVTFCFFPEMSKLWTYCRFSSVRQCACQVEGHAFHTSLFIQQEIRKTHHYRDDLHMCAQMSTWTHKSLVLVLYLITI